MTTIITRAAVVGGHDGRAEIEVELTYANGGTSTICLDEEACLASLDDAGVRSLDELIGRPWETVVAALDPASDPPSDPQGASHARPRHP